MATSFKTLQASDIQSSRTKLHEAIPITGTIVSGTYLVANESTNVKNFSHGMFQSVFDYPYLSSSANHIFDITVGLSANSALSASTNVQGKQKLQLYNQMAQILVGHDATGSIREFDKDGDGAAADSAGLTTADGLVLRSHCSRLQGLWDWGLFSFCL